MNIEDLFRFIDPNDVVQLAGFSTNLRIEALYPHIQTAQDLKIKAILGETLYSDLVDQFTQVNYIPNDLPDGTTLTNQINYKKLYEMIYKPLVFWTAFYSLDGITVKVEEKGLMVNTSDYSEPAQLEAKRIKEDRLRKLAEEYTLILHNYMEDTFKNNQTVQEESKEEGIRFSGMWFPKRVNSTKCNNNTIYKPF